jgi:hypothetical protein
MFTQAELDAQFRATAELGVADFIDAEYPDEVVEMAIDFAIEEFDAETDNGEWVDCTNYRACAERAIELFEDDARSMHETMMDDMAHAAADRAAGL